MNRRVKISNNVELDLPTPDDRPGADVLIFDGHCRLCTAAVRRLNRWDYLAQLAFLPLDDRRVVLRWPQLRREDLMREIHLVDRDGRIHRGAAVLRVLSRRLPTLWPVAPLLHLPLSLPVWQQLYALLAGARYYFGRVDASGGMPSCCEATGRHVLMRPTRRPTTAPRDGMPPNRQ